MTCVKCNPSTYKGTVKLCYDHWERWPKGKSLEEYLETNCEPAEPPKVNLPTRYLHVNRFSCR